MPSTYTLNNGIELIGTGEQSGTWGDTTNTNLGLLDAALDGQVTVALASAGSSGSPNSLPITDGTASNGRNRMVVFSDSGDLGATAYVQLTPNDAEKIIYIRNSLSGSRSVILFQGTYNASNDYEVPAGTTAVVYFDGAGAGAVAANVFNNAYFDGLRLGSVSVTAILDEDNMASDSATALATQQSIKAYVDSQVGTVDTLAEILAIGNTTGGTDIVASTTDKVQFRDAAIYINSSVDGQLDIVADTEIQIAATTVDVNGALDVSGTALVTGVLTTTAATVSNGGGQFNGAINVGVDDTGYDVKFFGATTGKSLLWDESADSLIVTGTTTLVGTTNLDAVDIDGATQIDATVTVGVDDTGYDVKFFGATAGAYMLWDESADDLILGGAAGLSVNSTALVTGVLTTTAATVSNGGGQFNGAINVGVDDTGYDVKFFGATAGAYMLWDESADDLILGGAAGLSVNSTALVTGVLTTTAATVFNGGFASNANSTVGGTLITTGNMSISETGADNEKSLTIANSSVSGALIGVEGSGGNRFVGSAVNNMFMGTTGADGLEFATNNTVRMVIESGGDVGIGTSSPDVFSRGYTRTVGISSNGSTSLAIQSAGDPHYPAIEMGRGSSRQFLIANQAAYSTIGTLENTPLSFITNDTERMRIDSSGGLITNPAAGGHAVFNEAGVDADFRVESDGNANMLFVDGGANYVGIGSATNYSAKLAVEGTKTLSAGIPNYQLSVIDDTAMGAGNGGAITLWGKYTTAGSYAEGASIEAYKSNGTSTNYQYGMWLKTRTHGGSMDDRLFMDQVQTVFNETGADTDFRVESDSNANALFVQASDGKVGIGTSSPETNNAASVGLTVGSGGGGAAIQLNVNGGGGIFSGTDTINNPNYSYRMGHLNGTNRLEMSTNNNDSYANGVVLSAGGTSWGTFSDERRKTDLVEITDGLNKVSTLRAVTGRYNYDDANVRRSMLIAQDVQAVLPEAVGAMTASMEDPTEYLTLNYTETIPLLVSALKDAKQLIEALTARITALENA
jgi:hypothetical protein